MSDFYKKNIEHAEELSIKSDQVVFLYNDTDEEYDIAGWIQEQLKFAAVGLKMDFAQD